VHGIDKKVILISKLWRGYIIRKQIRLAGSGVMKRGLCSNSEELSSLENIKSIPVTDYFGFEENGKVYGFDVRTMIDICRRNLNPINPYTRQPISINDRKRLRELFTYRLRNKLAVCYENNSVETIQANIDNTWNQICQIVEENGFFNIHPNLFLNLNVTQLYILVYLIHNDLRTWAAEHTPKSKRFLYVFRFRNILKKIIREHTLQQYSFFVSTTLLSILHDSVEPYTICFIIMSALYRL
jgi:hypothetical protein